MKISRNSLFYKFLDMFGDADALDSCKIVWLTLRNIIVPPILIFVGLAILFSLLYPIVGPIVTLLLGWKFLSFQFIIGLFLYALGGWIIVENYSSNYNHPMFESFKAWKNKTCIKVEVI